MLWLRGSIPYPYFYTNYWKYVHFFYATIIASRMPTPSLWIYLKTNQFFKMTGKCSIYYHFFILMYCVVTRSPLRLFSDQNFGKYVYMVNLLLQRITVGVLRSFPICLFESNWRDSHILSPHSYIIFTVLDLKFPIPCQINPKCREPFFENFVIFTDPKTYFKFLI